MQAPWPVAIWRISEASRRKRLSMGGAGVRNGGARPEPSSLVLQRPKLHLHPTTPLKEFGWIGTEAQPDPQQNWREYALCYLGCASSARPLFDSVDEHASSASRISSALTHGLLRDRQRSGVILQF